jgi:hypothetical protein
VSNYLFNASWRFLLNASYSSLVPNS